MADPTELKPRVLIVDDHPMVREGLKSMLAEEVGAWAEAENGEEALRKVSEMGPDLVLLDLQLPDLDGLTVLRRIKSLSPKTRVLVVTMHDRLAYVRQVMKAGAAGYVLKGIARRDLLAAVRAAVEGEVVIEPKLLRALLAEVATEADPLAGGLDALDPLTVVERDVLALVVQGLTNKEIATRLQWSVATAKKYVQRILEKLQVSDRTQAAAEAVRRGLVGPSPSESTRPGQPRS